MIKLKKLYSQPEIFDPITFEYGLNIIMGERSESSDKKIGVGKSICIEFLNYCLLKNYSTSRISLIPKEALDLDTIICLDLDFKSYQLTINRSLGNHERIVIFKDGEPIVFEKADEASEYLGSLYFEDYPVATTRISFRNLLAPIIRDERSEFKDIIKCFDTSKLIPRDYKPHLFFLNLDIELYNEIAKTISNYDKKSSFVSETKKLLTNNGTVKISDAKAHLNELESEVSKINSSIEQLKSYESFDVIQSDVIKFESKLSDLRSKQKAIRHEIKQITSFPQHENIDDNEIGMLFNQFKSGLGDIVSKSVEQTREFKYKIDNFRNTIIHNRLETIKLELSIITNEIKDIDEILSNKLNLIDNGTLVKDLKSAINIFNSKNTELSRLRSLIDRYDTSEREKKKLQAEKIKLISKLDQHIFETELIINSFKNTILDIHEKIMGNKEAHFEIKTTNNKEFINFILRTDYDGSHTTERMKVFIYDTALMFNEYTKSRHPGFLVHDNIFDKDDDTLEKSLNFIFKQDFDNPNTFQYILTLNSDLVDSIIRTNTLNFDISDYKVASFTKDSRFLKHTPKYTELASKK
ncbi:DUF2326 domain-containing protein [Hymenobacter glacieicola]|uniref:DUF2326 domain-containing protein n=1 Tax=Hymenobacter glacieicola TaxID=1562124 RepID=A0ABQ1WLZ6_9BACT|nr:DUF2326 domain-containing protein [Hymenobacter glacieicola]GGG37192.1 hypothetical protein GCM10011378_11880 [Hymenobacter glacieicola]